MADLVATSRIRWAKVIDHTRCIGCHACSTACKAENLVPLGVNRTYVKYVDVGTFPQARRAFLVTRCNQCDSPPCTFACPTAAMHRRDDGIVDFDKAICIGCKACIAACPYDAIFINPDDHSAEKCNFCAHRLDIGLEPACAVVCPAEAILVGDLHDRESLVARLAASPSASLRRPEKATRPMVFYRGAQHATLDPLAARRPDGGGFMWSQYGTVPREVTSGHPGPFEHADVEPVLAYDVPHRAPWDWGVSAYTWTKGIASGAYLVPWLLVAMGVVAPAGPLWQWVAPIVAGAFLGVTGLILIADLEHPRRFYLIFTRPQWRSWLVRGAVAITGYGAVLALHVAGSLSGSNVLQRLLMWPGVPIAILAAVYTAYLFAQAKARDLWQSALLPPQLLVQALLAGSATVLLIAPWLEPEATPVVARLTATLSAVQLLAIAGEIALAHSTPHARVAVHAMTRGRHAAFFWSGVILMTVGVLAIWLGPVGAVAALAGLLAYEHAFVQAGQSVPLA